MTNDGAITVSWKSIISFCDEIKKMKSYSGGLMRGRQHLLFLWELWWKWYTW